METGAARGKDDGGSGPFSITVAFVRDDGVYCRRGPDLAHRFDELSCSPSEGLRVFQTSSRVSLAAQ